jgi:hypothetical protein
MMEQTRRRAPGAFKTRLLDNSVLPPVQLLLGGLACVVLEAAQVTWNSLAPSTRSSVGAALLILLGLVVSLAGLVGAARLQYPARVGGALRWLLIPVALWCLFMAPQTLFAVGQDIVSTAVARPPHYGSDDMYYNHYNALLVLEGINPYTGNRLADAIHYFKVPAYTPIARGRFADVQQDLIGQRWSVPVREYLAHPQQPPAEIDPRTLHSYPAGAYLVNIPSVWAGLPSVAFPQVLIYVLIGATLIVVTPQGSRVIVALLYLSSFDAVGQVAGGDFEIWPLFLLIMAWLFYSWRNTSSALLGAACAVKQTAWIAAPFYLIHTWRTQGPRAALTRAGIALAAFLAINAPWAITAPRAWFASLWLPVSLPLIPGGSGVIGLSVSGALPLLPSWAYTALELATLAIALAWYWRAHARYPFAALLLPYLPLLMAWRSPERYFALLPLAAVSMLVLTLRAQSTVPAISPAQLSGHPAQGALGNAGAVRVSDTAG